MNWLTDLVRPKIKKLTKRETPENLWCKCPGCEQMVFKKELERNLSVCKECDHHFYMSPKARCASLFDDGQYKELAFTAPPDDPLKFRDLKFYTDRLKEARSKGKDAVMIAKGSIGACTAVVTIFDFKFIGGSMGTSVGEAILKSAAWAIKYRCPLIILASSGGARMQEGALSLMQMPRTLIALSQLKDAGLPFVSILTNPTMGGVSASFASLGDINLAEKGALIGFTGARIIQQFLRIKLPENFQTAEFQFAHGALDAVVHRHDLKKTLSTLLSLLTPKRKKLSLAL